MKDRAMLRASLRYALLALIIICNALFFWDVESGSVLAVAFGPSPADHDGTDGTRLTQTRFEQSNAYTFANPALTRRNQR